jgi:uncharacterized protein
MKLQTQNQRCQTVITACDDNSVEINAIRYEHSLLVSIKEGVLLWPVQSFNSLDSEHFLQIEKIHPNIVIFGTGISQKFIDPRLTTVFASRRIGFECMDNKAACHTYNILVSEGREVVMALIFER